METALQTQGNRDEYSTVTYKANLEINVGKRVRNLDLAKVAELAESIKREGMLNPITVARESNGALTLIAGNHRLAAMRKVWSEVDEPGNYTMPIREVICIPKHREVVEISENLNRNDLSAGERKILAARYGELMEKHGLLAIDQKPTFDQKPADGQKPQGGRPTAWFSDWAGKAKVPLKTAQRLWSDFCADTNRKMTPSEAEGLDRTAFFNWVKATEAKKQQDAEARKKADEASKKALVVKQATEAYAKAKRIFMDARAAYAKACDVAEKAGVQEVDRSMLF